MKLLVQTFLIITLLMTGLNCNFQKRDAFKSKVVYKSKTLVITQISENTFEHTSFIQTNDFGNVPCNGLIVKNNQEALIFDTPTNDQASEELIRWVQEKLHCRLNGIVPTHFHDDCLGGLQAFHEHGIPSYAYFKTIELAKEKRVAVPQNSFTEPLVLKVGQEQVTVKFFGEGHTRDNVVGYFPSEHVLFGGCLIKELGANKGYLGDANLEEWSFTVGKIKREYPNVKIVIPGHGEYGSAKLLDYTMELFKTPQK